MTPLLDELQRQLLLQPHDPRRWEQLEALLLQPEAAEPSEPVIPTLINWGPLATRHERVDQIFTPLVSLSYDGTSLTPLIGNVYGREPSGNGWIRWVGPEPRLKIQFPFKAGIEFWRFEVEIAKFFDKNDASSLRFHINGNGLPLLWAGENTYRAEIDGCLIDQAQLNDPAMGFSIMQLSIPSSHRPEGEDQRLLSFAIRQFSMKPLEVQR
jgi:hypothetical protein